MATILQPVKTAISIKLHTGVSPAGKATYTSFSFSSVSGSKTPADYKAFANAIAPLTEMLISEVAVNKYNRLEEI